MSVDVRSCPSCGASNRADAAWCSQCFDRFDADADAAGVPPSAAAEPSWPTGRRMWTCRLCESENPAEASECERCGASIYDSFGSGDVEVAVADPSAALRRSILFPGGGYGALGLGGLGFVVGFLAAISAIVGGAMLASGELWGLALLAVFLAAWVVSVLDVTRLLQGETIPLLRPRVLSVVGGVVLVVLLLVVASTFSASSG